MASVFDLTQNPFHLLRLSVRARREEVVEAYEEALADARAEEGVLVRAQQAVLTPRTRTEAELSWLSGIPPSQAREIVSALERNSLTDADKALERIEGLDHANLAADLCARADGQIKYVSVLLEAYEEFTVEGIVETLTGLRSVSGFPLPDRQQVGSALATLRNTHAKAAVACVTATTSPGETLTGIVEAFLVRDDADIRHLLDLIVREYDTWSEPQLGVIREKIERQITQARGQGSEHIPVQLIAMLLADWDAINQPVQLLEQSKGHEEPRSKEIYEIVRDFYLWLTNESGKHDEALAISRALLNTFPELEAAAAQLSKDVDALESLAEEAKSIELLRPLIEAMEAVNTELSSFEADVVVSGFGPNSRGLARKLFDAFTDAVTETADTEHADMPWMVVRSLALDLNNNDDSPDVACKILDGLLAYRGAKPSKLVADKLRTDQRTLRQNLKWKELERNSGDVKKCITIVSQMLDDADPDDQAALLELRSALEQKNAAAIRTRVFWGLAAVVVAGIWIYSAANEEPSYSSRPTSTSTYESPRPQASQPSFPRPAYDTASSFEEQKPPQGTSLALNRNQVRYCIFQRERLEILQGLVSNDVEAEIDGFNRLIGDFNSRCSNFRYYGLDMEAVRAELSGRRYYLRQEAQRLLSAWHRQPSPR